MRICFALPTFVPIITLGFDQPAKPAFVVAVPTSITIGWFKSAVTPAAAPLFLGVSVEAMVGKVFRYLILARHLYTQFVLYIDI